MLCYFGFKFFLHCVGFSGAYSIRHVMVRFTLNIYYMVSLKYTHFRCHKWQQSGRSNLTNPSTSSVDHHTFSECSLSQSFDYYFFCSISLFWGILIKTVLSNFTLFLSSIHSFVNIPGIFFCVLPPRNANGHYVLPKVSPNNPSPFNLRILLC